MSTLSPEALRRRLRDLAGNERDAQVDFLLHLAEFDDRKGYLDAGHGSLWSYCLRDLHLREGPAARRIAAMRTLGKHPELEAPLRDGRLCISTVTLIAPLFEEFGVADLVSRAAYLTKAEVEHLVASLRPCVAPRDGVRQLPPQRPTLSSGSSDIASAANASAPNASPARTIVATAALATAALATDAASASCDAGAGLTGLFHPATGPSSVPCATPRTAADRACELLADDADRSELRPVAADRWSLRVTMDASMKEDLETLRSLLSHTSSRDLTAVLREALRCAVEKHGKRRGAVAPSRARRSSATSADKSAGAAPNGASRGRSLGSSSGASRGSKPDRDRDRDGDGGRRDARCAPDARVIPASVRRDVWARDRGCCSWKSKDGRRCGSRWKLEVDHIEPVALGGKSTVDNLRLLCKPHNIRYAEQVFGRPHMDRFSRRARSSRGAPPAQGSRGKRDETRANELLERHRVAGERPEARAPGSVERCEPHAPPQ